MKRLNLSEWALRHSSLTTFLMFVLLLSGLQAYFTLGRAEDPEFTIKTMVVTAEWPGATAKEMELQVTDRMEKKLQEIPGLDYVQSYSKSGKSFIFVFLKESEPAVNVPAAWYQVRKKLADIRHELPEGVFGPFFNDEFGDTYGTIYAFTADGFSHAELKETVDEVRQEFLRIPDVAKVDLLGVQEEKIFIEFSLHKFATIGIDPIVIANIVHQQNAMNPAGQINGANDTIRMRVSGNLQSVEAMRELGLVANNRQFRLGDVSTIYRGYADPPTPQFRYNGESAIGLAISMRKGGDILKLGQHLEQDIARLKAHLPAGIEIHQVSDQPQVVKKSINEFMKTLGEAIVIVLSVSFISLGWRTGLVVALSIPLVLAITFLVMKICGIDLHRISLGALIIALGLLVDDAIISVEMMVVKMEQGWDRFRAATFAYRSTAFPMLTGTLVSVAGFMPVGFAKSSAGEYCVSIFEVVGIALIASWIVAVIFTPFIGYKILPDYASHAQGQERDAYQSAVYRIFRKVLQLCLRYRRSVLILTLLTFIGAIGLFRLIEQQFFPYSDRPELLVDLWLPQGASIAATATEAQKVEHILHADTDIKNYVTYIGTGSTRFYLPLDQQLQHDNFAQLVILTKDLEARERVMQRLQTAFAEQDFTLLRARVNRLENGPPVGFPVQFRVSGPDQQQIRRIAEEVAAIVRQNPVMHDVHLDWGEQSKVLHHEVDLDKIRGLGISSQDIGLLLQSALSGFEITEYREKNKLIKVLARAEAQYRSDPSRVGEFYIHTPKGPAVPLGQLVTIHHTFEDGIIWRRDRFPVFTVRGDIVGKQQAPDVTAQIAPMLNGIRAKLPDGYRIEAGGAVESSSKAQESINAIMPLMLFTITTLLMLQLQSMQRTLMVLLTAPLGLIGVTLILLCMHVPFGFVATLGVIALAGMIMRNSVILVDQIDRDIASGTPAQQAIVDAAVRRLRPILLTAAAAILGMIPLTQSVFWGPMALSIMGGLLVATLLTVLFLPALYATWFKVDYSAHA